MKSLIVFVLSIFLAVNSLQAQGLEVKNVIVGGYNSNDNIFKSDTKMGRYNFSIVVQVLCEGKVDSLESFIDHDILVINVLISAESILRCPGYNTRIRGSVIIDNQDELESDETAETIFKAIQYRVVSRVKNMPTQYNEIKMYNQNGVDITPPAFR